jgi:cephalosporin hydroxylase
MTTGNKVDLYYQMECNRTSDINEHLPTLLELANECETVTELGVRYAVSVWAHLKSSARRITLCDLQKPDVWLNHPQNLSPTPCTMEEIEAAAPHKDIYFFEGSSLDIEITDTDLLFIDSFHSYSHLKAELDKHAHAVNKYIALHDIQTFKHRGQDGSEGLQKAIDEFLADNKEWSIHMWHTNNHGLGVLKRC